MTSPSSPVPDPVVHRLPFAPTHESCVAWVEKHRRFYDREAEGVVEVWKEWRGVVQKDGTIAPRWVYSLCIVCPGHYAFERDSGDLDDLWRQAVEVYSDPTYAYASGCDGSCLTLVTDCSGHHHSTTLGNTVCPACGRFIPDYAFTSAAFPQCENEQEPRS